MPNEVLLERTFEVPMSNADAWAALADVAAWPAWAPHIAAADVSPPGPVTPETSGSFRFRPAGRARFRMTDFDPPRSWTWTGRVMGLTIDYDHRSETIAKLIFASIALVGVSNILTPPSSWHVLLWLETVCVLHFGISWLVKGGFLGILADRTAPAA